MVGLFEEWIWLGFNFYQCNICISTPNSGQRVQTTFQKIGLLFTTSLLSVISTSDSCNSIIYQDCNKCSGAIYMSHWLYRSYYARKMRAQQYWNHFWYQMSNQHLWQLKKSKSWGPFWSYQLNSTANPAHLPQRMGQMG